MKKTYTDDLCRYDYYNKCDCAEDDRCGCDYPNNMPHNFSPDCFNKKSTPSKRKKDNCCKDEEIHIHSQYRNDLEINIPLHNELQTPPLPPQ